MGGGSSAGWFQCGFRVGGPVLVPVPVVAPGPVVAVRPSWSSVGMVAAAGAAAAAPVMLQGALQGSLPPDCLDVLLSETHLLLLRREAVLEGWEVRSAPGLEGRPAWQRELCLEDAGPALPLVPGGYVFPWPPFFAPLPATLRRVQKLALGQEHAVLLDEGGVLFTWGSSRHGQLGHGALESLSEPQRVEALHGMPMGDVAAGGWHSACISEAGDLYIWGWNEAGQLALPSKGGAVSRAAARGSLEQKAAGPASPAKEMTVISIQAFPALLDLPQGAEVHKVSCGSRHTAAVTRAGDLYTWGWGKYGQLGHADTASSDQPRRVHFFVERGLCVVDVVCGPWTTYTHAGPSSSPRLDPSSPQPESPGTELQSNPGLPPFPQLEQDEASGPLCTETHQTQPQSENTLYSAEPHKTDRGRLFH